MYSTICLVCTAYLRVCLQVIDDSDKKTLSGHLKKGLVNWGLELPNGLSKHVTVGKMLVQNSEYLLIQQFVGTNTLHHFLYRL